MMVLLSKIAARPWADFDIAERRDMDGDSSPVRMKSFKGDSNSSLLFAKRADVPTAPVLVASGVKLNPFAVFPKAVKASSKKTFDIFSIDGGWEKEVTKDFSGIFVIYWDEKGCVSIDS
jgi:hypothetical protein